MLKIRKTLGGVRTPVDAGDDYPLPVGFPPDAGTGAMTQGKVTTDGVAETPTAAIEIPDTARLLILYADTRCRLAIGEAPGAIGTSAAPAAGGWLHPGQPLAVILPAGEDRTFQLRSATASVDVYFEFRP